MLSPPWRSVGLPQRIQCHLSTSVQDDTNAPGQCHHRTLCTSAFSNQCSPPSRLVERRRCIMTVAAWHNALRRLSSLARVMPPVTSRSPDWLRDGVSPAHGPTFLDDENRAGSSTPDRKAKATTAPIPGIVINSRHTASSFDEAAGTAGMKLTERPQAAINDVIVGSTRVGLCANRTKLAVHLTDRVGQGRTPSIPGHEFAGVVSSRLWYHRPVVGTACTRPDGLVSRRHPGGICGSRGAQPRAAPG